jgi:hypothetical protein
MRWRYAARGRSLFATFGPNEYKKRSVTPQSPPTRRIGPIGPIRLIPPLAEDGRVHRRLPRLGGATPFHQPARSQSGSGLGSAGSPGKRIKQVRNSLLENCDRLFQRRTRAGVEQMGVAKVCAGPIEAMSAERQMTGPRALVGVKGSDRNPDAFRVDGGLRVSRLRTVAACARRGSRRACPRQSGYRHV